MGGQAGGHGRDDRWNPGRDGMGGGAAAEASPGLGKVSCRKRAEIVWSSVIIIG